jgi:hypothetical protein
MHNPNLQIELIKACNDELRRRTSHTASARAAGERSGLRHVGRRSVAELISRRPAGRTATYIPDPRRTS